MAQVSKCAGLGARLGLVASTAELTASLSPSDYLYGAPTEAQRQHFLRQATSPSGNPNQQAAVAPSMADGYGTRAALQGAAPAAAAVAASTHKPCPLTGAAASVDELFNSHLALDLDEDCLKLLLLGEEAAQSRPCASGSGGSSGPTAGSGSGTSQKSSATADEAAARGEAEAEAASLPFAKDQQAEEEEDDDIAMLFANHAEHRGPASMEPLELQLLGAAHAAGTGTAGAADDSDTASQAGSGAKGEAAGETAAGASKRAKQSGGWEAASPSPSGRGAAGAIAGGGLMLSMDYERAAESINLELLAAGRKAPACHDLSLESMLPMLSPLYHFAQTHTPDSPDSLASGCDGMGPQLPFDLIRQDSSSKRKRAAAVHA